VAGTIPVDKLAAFERLLFRATRGNMFLKFTPVSRRPPCMLLAVWCGDSMAGGWVGGWVEPGQHLR
jgi:hypothetical protein